MDRLLGLLIVGLFSSNALASVENFQGLIDATSTEQAQAEQPFHRSTTPFPLKGAVSSKRGDSEFKIRLVRMPWKKRTMIAGSPKKASPL